MPIARLALPALIVGCLASAAPRGAQADLSGVQQRIDRLEALTLRVEALSSIKRLQHAYGHYSELGLWHDFADLFADTGVGYYTQGALDREGIRSLFLKEVGGGRLGLADGRIYPHISMQPVVTLAADGRSARGRWHIMAMLGGYNGNASWSGGVYENQYVLENGVWKMNEVRYHPQYSGRYEAPAWTATRDVAPVHYDADRVGKPILITDGDSFRLKADATRLVGAAGVEALAKRLADLSARAQRLNDEIDVTNLQHAYGYYVDRKMWDDAADLFATDATMEIGLQGVYVGQKKIRRGLNAFGSAGLADGEVNDHVHLQTIVTVMPDGRTARARGTELGMTATGGPPSPGSSGKSAVWSQSIYENEFVNQNGVWKFKAMRVYPRFIVDAAQGWAKNAQPAPGPSKTFPPDRPPTELYEIYPRFHIAPLHFDHPVTGRPPQYPSGTTVSPRPRSTVRATASPTSVRALESLLTTTERSIARSQAYHASENLTAAHGYTIDESARVADTLTLHQIVQPVIHVAPDGRSARIRVRLFQLGNSPGGVGTWTSGIYENAAVDEAGTWTLSRTNLDTVWTAPSRGGWGGIRPLPGPHASFHYRNPVSGRMPPVLLQ